MPSSWSKKPRRAGGDVRMLTPVYPRQNVGRQGADIVVGQTVIARGDVLNPSRIGALAALGVGDVEVYAKPSRRDPLDRQRDRRSGHRSCKPGQIYDINKFTLSTIIQEHGGVPMPFATAQDTIEALERAIDACAACDVLVFSGGSSVGERDLILDVIEPQGRDRVSRHRRQARQADRVRHDQRQADVRHARLSDLVPVERLHAAGAGAARDGAARAAPHRDASRCRSDSASSRRRDGTSSTR